MGQPCPSSEHSEVCQGRAKFPQGTKQKHPPQDRQSRCAAQGYGRCTVLLFPLQSSYGWRSLCSPFPSSTCSWPTLQSPHHFSSSPAHVLASQGTTHCALLNYTQIRCNALSLCIKVGRKISCLREKQNKTKTQNQTNTKITTNQPTNKTHQVPVHSMFCQGVSLA